MKLLTGLVFGLVSAARDGKPNRKVPPRHPENRLNRLANKLAVDILHHPNLSWPQKRKDRILDNLQKFAEKMKQRFNSDNCGYYNSELKHGGPDPNPDKRENGKPRNPVARRKRRQTSDNWRTNWWIAADTQFGWLYEACFAQKVSDDAMMKVIDGWFAEDEDEAVSRYDFYLETSDDICDEDETNCEWFDDSECQFKNGAGETLVRGKRKGRKLSDNPQKAWKQVTTGLKKWALRYLNNCYGMRKDKKPANRAKAMYSRHVDKFPTSWN